MPQCGKAMEKKEEKEKKEIFPLCESFGHRPLLGPLPQKKGRRNKRMKKKRRGGTWTRFEAQREDEKRREETKQDRKRKSESK